MNLLIIKKRIHTSRKKLRQALKIYNAPSGTMADIYVQSNRAIGIVSRLEDEIKFVQRNLYYYRPTIRKFERTKKIISEFSDAHYRIRKDGRNDLRKDLDKAKSERSLHILNSALDDNEDILTLVGIMHELGGRRGLHDNYIGDRLWNFVASAIIAILTGAIGLLLGILFT